MLGMLCHTLCNPGGVEGMDFQTPTPTLCTLSPKPSGYTPTPGVHYSALSLVLERNHLPQH